MIINWHNELLLGSKLTFLKAIVGQYTKKNSTVRIPILTPSFLSLSKNFFASSGLIFVISLDILFDSR